MMSNSGFGHADAHSYNATSSLGVSGHIHLNHCMPLRPERPPHGQLDLEGLRANLDQLAAGELERSQSPTWRVSPSAQVLRLIAIAVSEIYVRKRCGHQR